MTTTRTPRASKTTRYLLSAALLTGGVTVGAFLSPIGLASADDESPTTSTLESEEVSEGGVGEGYAHTHAHRHRRGGGEPGERAEALAGVIGITTDELRAGFEAGQTLAEIAADHGVSGDELAAAMLAEMEERLDEAVAEGRIDAEKAEERLANAEEHIDEAINREPGEGKGGFGHHGRGQHQVVQGLRDVADDLGLSTEEIREAMADGATMAEAAEAQGVSEDDLQAAIVAEAEERLAEAVAEGHLDEDRAAEISENLAERVDAMVNREPGEGFRDGKTHVHRHRHGPRNTTADDS